MRPGVHLNCASSLDGRLASPDGSPLRFSDEGDLRRVHALRAACDAILVGVGTVVADDPSLRVKPELAAGPDPLRVVLDPTGRTPADARVLDGSAATLVVTGPDLARTDWRAAETVALPLDGDGRLPVAGVLAELGRRGVASILVEGGAAVLRAFLESGAWDTFTLFQAPVLIGGDGPQLWPGAPADPPWPLRLQGVELAGAGALWTFAP
jgi:riboflavin-specific deaminase-like protein